MTNLTKPNAATIASATQTLDAFVRMYNALVELQQLAAAQSPATAAAKAGAPRIVFIPALTVTDPATGESFVANVYALAVQT